jgi:hypothetical protein
MTASLRVSLIRILWRWSLPLACYYAVTLVVPVANGAARQGVVFASHALIVLVFPLLLMVIACALGTFAEMCRRAATSSGRDASAPRSSAR